MIILGRSSLQSLFTGRAILEIEEAGIKLTRRGKQLFFIRWTQLERIDMDRNGPFKLLRFKCFDRTEIVSTRHFKQKDLKSGYFLLVELALANYIKVIEVRGW